MVVVCSHMAERKSVMRYVFIFKDGRALTFADEQGACEWLMEVFPVIWPETVLREEGEHTWERVVPEIQWSASDRKYRVTWQYYT